MIRFSILGVKINIIDIEEVLRIIKANLSNVRGKYICLANVHTVVMSNDDPNYKAIQNNSFMTLPDGKPLSVVGRARGYKQIQRVAGPDLMEQVFKMSEREGYTHYFYGSTDETLKRLICNITKKYPKLKIVGKFSPPFRELTTEEDREIIKAINDAGPDFLWVGLGAPKQEVWMSEHSEKCKSLMIGVGAGFDYHALNLKRAPEWMQKYSLEWLYRLIQEPTRLSKRYLRTNIKFLTLLFYEGIRFKSRTN